MNNLLEKSLLEKKEFVEQIKRDAITHFNEQILLKKEEEGLAILMQHPSPIDIDTWDFELKDIRIQTKVIETLVEEYVGIQYNLACDFLIEGTICSLIYETPFIQAGDFTITLFKEGFTIQNFVVTLVEKLTTQDRDVYFKIFTQNNFNNMMPELIEMQEIKNNFDLIKNKSPEEASFLHYLKNFYKLGKNKLHIVTTEERIQLTLYSLLNKLDLLTNLFRTQYSDYKILFIRDFIEKQIEIDTLEKMADEVQYLEIVKDVKYCFSTQKEQYIDVLLNTPHETMFKVPLSSLPYTI